MSTRGFLIVGVLGMLTAFAEARMVRFAVVADPHYFAPALGVEGEAFERAVQGDRKMIREGPAILDAVLDDVLRLRPAFVLVPGDLTKDGEQLSHEEVAARFDLLVAAGINVLVTPGNHDIENPGAYGYAGSQRLPVPTVTPSDFAALYARHGMGDALDRDPASLSYLAEPVPGLRILSLDSAWYEDNVALGRSVTAGRIRPETLTWALRHLEQARRDRVPVFAFMHHGLLSHARIQNSLFRDYLVEDWLRTAARLAGAGLQVVFTGHFHAQEMIGVRFGPRTLYDIKTASLVTYPVAYRICTYDPVTHRLFIQSIRVKAIDADTDGVSFQEFARRQLEEAVIQVGRHYLPLLGLELPRDLETALLTLAGRFAVAHFSGDEQLLPAERRLLEALAGSRSLILRWLGATGLDLMTDRPPADNQALLQLAPP
ncbi:MAG TPA: metallophosphoesterase [Kiritimatiellia bacterium]|nr:metallophosphoesterase [Kiritimatiellia bacterium]